MIGFSFVIGIAGGAWDGGGGVSRRGTVGGILEGIGGVLLDVADRYVVLREGRLVTDGRATLRSSGKRKDIIFADLILLKTFGCEDNMNRSRPLRLFEYLEQGVRCAPSASRILACFTMYGANAATMR